MKAMGLVISLAAASLAFAQGDGGGQGGGGRGMGGNFGPERILGGTIDELKEKLTLTEKQVPQVQAVFDETTQIMQEAMQNLQEQGGGGGFQGMREILNKMRDEQRTALKEALDDTQKAAYDKMLADQDAQRAAGFGGRGGRGGRQESPERRKQRLDATITLMGLNEEQAGTIRPLIEKYNELNDSHNKAWSDGQAALTKLIAEKDSTDEAIEAQLTTMRDAVKAVDKDLKEARGLLKDALTPRQEAQLVVAGFLDK